MSGHEPGAPTRVRFGQFELDLRRGELTSSGRPVRLSPQPCKLLALLVSRPGELVTRDEIRRHLWGDGTHVSFDASLNFCIRRIRLALHDHGEAPRFIATFPKRGYRFIAPVEVVCTNGDGLGRRAEPRPANTPPVRRLDTGAGGAGGRGGSGAARGHERVRPGPYHLFMAVVGIAIAALSLFIAHPSGLGGAQERIRIAVLPFQDIGAQQAHTALGESLTDELILQLSRAGAERVAVIARTSALAYEDSPKTVKQIGGELGVSYIVEGTLRSSPGGRVRLGVTLVRASDQSAVWAEVWEERPDALLPLQREVAARVTRALPVE